MNPIQGGASKEPEVNLKMGGLAGALEILEKGVVELEGRLGPVLTPGTGAKEIADSKKAPEPPKAPLVRDIEGFGIRVLEMAARVVGIISRLEV